MAEERCECCDLPESSCGKAAEKRRAAEERREIAALLARPDVFLAQYPGRCTCGEMIDVGSPIRRTPEGYEGRCCL